MRTRVRVGRIIVYGILFTILIILNIFLQSHLFLIMTVLFVTLPLFSLAMLPVVVRGTSLEMNLPSPVCEKNAVSYVELSLKNRSIFMSLDAKIHFRAENLFYGVGQDMVISFPVRIHSTYKQLIPMKLSRLGRVDYTVDAFRITDLMGFLEYRKKVHLTAEQTIMPVDAGLRPDQVRTDLTLGMTESDETKKKGNDFSDVTDVREYIPGDKLMSIHWKLTAKRDILMVKDRSSMSDQQLLLLTDLSGSPAEQDEVLELSYNLTRLLLDTGTYVRFLWWNEKTGEFEERVIDQKEHLKEAFLDIYHTERYKNGEMLTGYLANIRPELTAFVRIRYAEGKADAEIISLG